MVFCALKVMKTVKIRKLIYLAHIMCNTKKNLLQLAVQGKINSKRVKVEEKPSVKEPTIVVEQDINKTFRSSSNKLILGRMIANII